MAYQPTPLEAFGGAAVNTGYQTLFYDAWTSSPIDTGDKWTVTGAQPTITNGDMTMSAAAGTYNAIRTKDALRANVGYTHVRNAVQLEATAATGAGRFFGLGTPAATPGPAVLAQDGPPRGRRDARLRHRLPRDASVLVH